MRAATPLGGVRPAMLLPTQSPDELTGTSGDYLGRARLKKSNLRSRPEVS